MSPPFGTLSNYAAKEPLSPQERIKAEAGSKEDRRFKTLREFSEATGQDRHSVIVDYDVFQKVTAPDPNDPTILYKPADFDFELRPGFGRIRSGTACATLRSASVKPLTKSAFSRLSANLRSRKSPSRAAPAVGSGSATPPERRGAPPPSSPNLSPD